MKIFVTGATGVLGRRAVAQLLATGGEVTGVARTRSKAETLQTLGATPVEVSLFDRDALSAAVAGHQVVCNLATAVPTGEQAVRPDPWESNHRIRRKAPATSSTLRSMRAQRGTSRNRSRVALRRRWRHLPGRIVVGRADRDHRAGTHRRVGSCAPSPNTAAWASRSASGRSTASTAVTRSRRSRQPSRASSPFRPRRRVLVVGDDRRRRLGGRRCTACPGRVVQHRRGPPLTGPNMPRRSRRRSGSTR